MSYIPFPHPKNKEYVLTRKRLPKGNGQRPVVVTKKTDPSKKFVMKKFSLDNRSGEESIFRNEVEVLLRIRNLVDQHQLPLQRLEEWWEDEKEGVIIAEFIEGYNLYEITTTCSHYLSGDERFLPDYGFCLEFIQKVYQFLTSCLSKLHQEGIYHRDVRCENVIYNPDTGLFHIIDFGISFDSTSGKKPVVILITNENEFFLPPNEEDYTHEDQDNYHLASILLSIMINFEIIKENDKIVEVLSQTKQVPSVEVLSQTETKQVPDEIRQFILSAMGNDEKRKACECAGYILSQPEEE